MQFRLDFLGGGVHSELWINIMPEGFNTLICPSLTLGI